MGRSVRVELEMQNENPFALKNIACALVLGLLAGVAISACSEENCEIRPPREQECRAGEEPISKIPGVCAEPADEGSEFEIDGRCTWVVCIEVDSDGECEQDEKSTNFWKLQMRRMEQLNEELDLEFPLDYADIRDVQCTGVVPTDGLCCSKVQFYEVPPEDGPLCRGDQEAYGI
jgi:hypothetical protein